MLNRNTGEEKKLFAEKFVWAQTDRGTKRTTSPLDPCSTTLAPTSPSTTSFMPSRIRMQKYAVGSGGGGLMSDICQISQPTLFRHAKGSGSSTSIGLFIPSANQNFEDIQGRICLQSTISDDEYLLR